MEMKCYEVKLLLDAPNREAAERIVDKMCGLPMANAYGDGVFHSEIFCAEEDRRYEERIRYVEDWHGEGEHFVFEGKWSDEKEWGLDSAFKLLDYHDKDGNVPPDGKGILLNYQALTKIRELKRMGVEFHFGN